MTNLFQNTLAGTISGILVAAVSFYFFAGSSSQPKVSLTYEAIPYESELGALAFTGLNDLADGLGIKRGKADPFDELSVEDLEKIELVNEFVENSLFSRYGLIEYIVVDNSNKTSAVEVLVEGHDTNGTLIEAKSVGKLIRTGEFSEKIKILPDDKLEILNVDEGSFRSYRHDNQGSRSLLVSTGDSYLVPLNRITILDDLFGVLMKRYPFVFFLLFVFGTLFFIMCLVELIARSNKEWHKKLLASQLNKKTLAIVKEIIAETDENSAAKLSSGSHPDHSDSGR